MTPRLVPTASTFDAIATYCGEHVPGTKLAEWEWVVEIRRNDRTKRRIVACFAPHVLDAIDAAFSYAGVCEFSIVYAEDGVIADVYVKVGTTRRAISCIDASSIPRAS